MRKPIYFLLLFGMLILTSCNRFDEFEQVDDVNYNAEFALPIVNTKVSIQQFLENFEENSTLIIDPDGLLRFVYRGDVITTTSDDIFAEINNTLAMFPIIPVLSYSQELPFSSPDGLDIDRLELKGGTLVYYFENKHNVPLDVTISFPEVKKDGEPLVYDVSVPASVDGEPIPFRTNILAPTQLVDYTIEPTDGSVYINYEALRPNGEQDTLHNFAIQIQDFEFEYAEGYLGNQIHEGGRDTIVIDFFDNWVRGDVYFEDPTVTFYFENSFGIPTRSIINKFEVFTVTSDILPLQSDIVMQGIDFPYPELNEVGEVKYQTFVFDKENSNIDSILGAGPLAVDYDVDAITNPDGNTGIRGFITDESYYKVQVEVELPLYGQASNFIARDTFDLSFDNYDNVNYAEFKLVTENRLPISVDVQGYFLDENGVVLDSLLDSQQRIIEGAPVDGEGVVTNSNAKETLAPFSTDQFDKIKNTTRLAIVAAFFTTGNGEQSVKVFSDQDVAIKLGAKLGIED